jgi:hypothetical protein
MSIRTHPSNPAYSAGYDRIFRMVDSQGQRTESRLREEGPRTWSGCEAALVGYLDCADGVRRAVYERNALVQVFIDQGMDRDDADEWVSVNIAGAYIGRDTPLLVEWNWATDPITPRRA